MEIPPQNAEWKKIFLWAENWWKVAKDNLKERGKKNLEKQFSPHSPWTTKI